MSRGTFGSLVSVLFLAALLPGSAAPQSPCIPTTGCPGQQSVLGCVPKIDAKGCSSASASHGFAVTATGVRNEKVAVLLYDTTGIVSPTPFQGGLLCVAQPIFRTPARSSGGHPLPIQDCSGNLRIDMTAFAAGAFGGLPMPSLRVPGTAVSCQWWIRDPGSPHGSILSNALRYVVGS